MQPEFISIKDAAVIFAVNECTIRRAIRKGFICAIRMGEGPKSPYRISRRSIDDIHNRILAIHELLSKKD